MPFLVSLRAFFLCLAAAAALPSAMAAEERRAATPIAEKLIRIDIGAGAPPTVTVAKGERVRLEVLTGRPGEFHLHGYDVVSVAGAEGVATFVFTAAHTGRFAIVGHSHGGKDLLGRTETPLAYVEVRPQ